jgi:hypothetical protein
MTVRKYRVREGFSYGAFNQHKAGTIVELEEEVAKYVMDKLELAEIVHNVPPPVVEPLLPPLPVFTEEEEVTEEVPPIVSRKPRKKGS